MNIATIFVSFRFLQIQFLIIVYLILPKHPHRREISSKVNDFRTSLCLIPFLSEERWFCLYQ